MHGLLCALLCCSVLLCGPLYGARCRFIRQQPRCVGLRGWGPSLVSPSKLSVRKALHPTKAMHDSRLITTVMNLLSHSVSVSAWVLCLISKLKTCRAAIAELMMDVGVVGRGIRPDSHDIHDNRDNRDRRDQDDRDDRDDTLDHVGRLHRAESVNASKRLPRIKKLEFIDPRETRDDRRIPQESLRSSVFGIPLDGVSGLLLSESPGGRRATTDGDGSGPGSVTVSHGWDLIPGWCGRGVAGNIRYARDPRSASSLRPWETGAWDDALARDREGSPGVRHGPGAQCWRRCQHGKMGSWATRRIGRFVSMDGQGVGACCECALTALPYPHLRHSDCRREVKQTTV